MKPQTVLLPLFGLAISISAFSQFSVGPEIGLTIAKAHDRSFGVGGSIRYEALSEKKLRWTCAIGYLSFPNKSYDGLPTLTKIVPVSGGVKYYFSKPRKGLYSAVDLGVNFMVMTLTFPQPVPIVVTEINIRTGFSAGMGYRTNRWDLSARYNLFAWIYDERFDSRINANYASLRVAYIFGTK